MLSWITFIVSVLALLISLANGWYVEALRRLMEADMEVIQAARAGVRPGDLLHIYSKHRVPLRWSVSDRVQYYWTTYRPKDGVDVPREAYQAT